MGRVPGAGDWTASGCSRTTADMGFSRATSAGARALPLITLMLGRGCSKQRALAAVGWEPQDGRWLSGSIPHAARQSPIHLT